MKKKDWKRERKKEKEERKERDKRKKEEREIKEEKEKKEMKILAVGDLHGDSRQAEKLAQLAEKENVDLVILSGDLTFAETKLDYLVGPFAKRKKEVLIIPGNHETVATADFLAKLYKPYVKNLHGKGIKLKKGKVGIFAAGGANIGLFQLSEKEIYELLKEGYEEIKDAKIKLMVTHVHPSNTLIEKLSFFVPGSKGVEKAIHKFKPNIAICSHVHEAEGIEEKIGKTKIINVGREGKIIKIKLDRD